MPETISRIYAEKVRSQRTRSFHLDIPQRENQAEILFTLLGIELQVGKRRFACPDLSTARYLRVFARLGCRDVAIPYDITKISYIADELEMAWQTLNLQLNEAAADSTPRSASRRRSSLIKEIREQIADLGAGSVMPEFNQNTKQRK